MNRDVRLVVNFHGIGEPWSAVPDDERSYWCPSDRWPAFADELAAMTDRAGMPVDITFDDGNASDIEFALPILAARGLRATFFPCAARLGQPGYLSADDLTALRTAGMAIGSHGWAHRNLRRTTPSELRRETNEARQVLCAASQGPIDAFAVPFGSYDRRALKALREFDTVYTSDRALAKGTAWLKPRFSYTTDWTPDILQRLAQPTSGFVNLRRHVALMLKRLR